MTAGERPGGQPWYRDGLRFACTQCGNCCTGPPGAVWFDDQEGAAMAAALGLSAEEFLARYARRIVNRWSLEERVTEHGHDCIFLDRTSVPGRAVCGVYGARPSQCRTWPFWDSNLVSRKAWDSARERVPCPGMGAASGRIYSAEEIGLLRREDARRSEQTP
ncbi:MAG: YkgJ family cysteine cluster protein [Phycisphaerales bacterium]